MTLQVAPPDVTTPQDEAVVDRQSGWALVAEQETRDLWTSGRGLILLFLFSILLSGVTYLTSTNQALNFLEQRESVNLVLQLAVLRRESPNGFREQWESLRGPGPSHCRSPMVDRVQLSRKSR